MPELPIDDPINPNTAEVNEADMNVTAFRAEVQRLMLDDQAEIVDLVYNPELWRLIISALIAQDELTISTQSISNATQIAKERTKELFLEHAPEITARSAEYGEMTGETVVSEYE